jgi:hypothetical protein
MEAIKKWLATGSPAGAKIIFFTLLRITLLGLLLATMGLRTLSIFFS